MTLSADDQVTVVELAVIVLGVVITWVVYRRSGNKRSGLLARSRAMRRERTRDSSGSVRERVG